MAGIVISGIYCDDVRSELGGKLSYMGVYDSELIVPNFPVQISKLCLHVQVRFPIDTQAQNMMIRVLHNETLLAEIASPEGVLQGARNAALAASQSSVSPPRLLNTSVSMEFGNLQITAPGTVHLIGIIDGEEIRGNGLRIRLSDNAVPHQVSETM